MRCASAWPCWRSPSPAGAPAPRPRRQPARPAALPWSPDRRLHDRQRQLHAGAHRRRPQLRPQPPRRRPAARARPHPPLRRPAAARRQVRLPARAAGDGALVVAGLAAPAPCRRHLRGRAALAAQPAARQRPRRRARRSRGRDHARGDRRALAAAARPTTATGHARSSWSPTRSWRSHPGTPTAARRPTTRCMSAPASCARWVRSSPATATSSRGKAPHGGYPFAREVAFHAAGGADGSTVRAHRLPGRAALLHRQGHAGRAGGALRPAGCAIPPTRACSTPSTRSPACGCEIELPAARHGRAAPGRRLCRRRDGGRRRDRPPPAPAQARSRRARRGLRPHADARQQPAPARRRGPALPLLGRRQGAGHHRHDAAALAPCHGQPAGPWRDRPGRRRDLLLRRQRPAERAHPLQSGHGAGPGPGQRPLCRRPRHGPDRQRRLYAAAPRRRASTRPSSATATPPSPCSAMGWSSS